jgi:hypothetical protein
MMASTLTQDRMEDVVPHAGNTPNLFQLDTPTDKELAARFLRAPNSPVTRRSWLVVTLIRSALDAAGVRGHPKAAHR